MGKKMEMYLQQSKTSWPGYVTHTQKKSTNQMLINYRKEGTAGHTFSQSLVD